MQFKTQELDPQSQLVHNKALACARKFLQAEAELLGAIMEVDRLRIFEKFGEAALTPYCIKILKLDENEAATLVRVARKCESVPALKRALEEGRITLFKARVIAPLLTPENQSHWIHLASKLTKAKLEDSVNEAAGRELKKLRLAFTKEQFELLIRAREIVSQKMERDVTWEETIREAANHWLDRNDPVRKANRNLSKSANDRPQGRSPTNSLKIPSRIRHAVNRRDEGKCQATLPDGTQCGHSTWVHLHHIVPRERGGPDTVENLTTLCSSHHRQWHATT